MMWGVVIAAGLASLLCIEVLRRLAPALGLLDHPGAHRSHDVPTPLVGGLGIGAVFLLTLLWTGQYQGLCLGLLVLLVVGVIDDRFEISHFWRFAAQIAAALLVVTVDGIVLTDLGELIPGQNVFLNAWSVPLTVFAIVGVINALNMSDGMDGLLTIFSLLVIAYFLGAGVPDRLVLLALTASLIVFLGYNLRIKARAARVYLGDAGSTFLGLLIAWVLIRYTQTSPPLLSPIAALWVIALPLMDAVTVLVVRPIFGSSPFSADKTHYHHYLFKWTGSVHWTLACIALLTGIGFVIAVLTTRGVIEESASFGLFMAVFFCWFMISLLGQRAKRKSSS